MTTQYVNGDVLVDFLPPVPSGKVSSAHFSSPSELYAFTQAKGFKAGAWCRDAWNENESAYGATLDDVERFARDGWPEGAEKIAALRDVLIPDRPTGPRIVRYDVAGALPSVPRAIAGNPMNMRRVTVAPTARQPVLTLVQDMVAPWGADHRCFTASAVASCAIVDLLEGAGFRVEIVAAFRSGNDMVGEVACRVKEAGDAVNLATLAFALGSPAFFRVFCFRVMHGHKAFEPLGSSLGRCRPFDASKCPPGVYLLPGPSVTSTKNPRDAMAMQIKSLRAQGCPGIPAEDEAEAA